MDIPFPPPTTTTTTTTTTTVTSPTKNPDPDDRIPIPKPLPPPFTNGVLKRHKPRPHHNPSPVIVSYKECLKNHAASMGGHAVDGCGEFMPSPMSTPTDPTSIKCAACGCHRNFHRREPDGLLLNNPSVQHVIEYQPLHRHQPPPPPQPLSIARAREASESPTDSPSPPPISSSYYPSGPHMLMALSSGLSAPPPEITHTPVIPGGVIGSSSSGKKRFRTKFTQDQKDKMHELAERVGWKMQKKDEELILNFCSEIGVDKGVFKVWMHNNKLTIGSKKDSGHQLLDSGSSGGGVDFLIDRNNHQYQQQQQLPQNNDSISSGGGNVTGTNGSSSSS